MDQPSIFDVLESEHEEPDVDALFRPNGTQRCEHCRRPLTGWAGKLYCLHVGCSGVSR